MVLALCALVVLSCTVSPFCPACDGFPVAHAGSHGPHRADLPLPLTDDGCNGICACCDLQWVSGERLQALTSVPLHRVEAAESSLPLSLHQTPPLPPPRLLPGRMA
jgi:hypothetical protein